MKKQLINLALISCLVSTSFPSVSFAEEVLTTNSAEQNQQDNEQSSDSAAEETTQTTDPIPDEEINKKTSDTSDKIAIKKATDSSSQLAESTVDSTATHPTNDALEVPSTPDLVATEPTTPSDVYFDKNTTTEEFIVRVGEYARKVGQENDLFASVMIAQAILESGSGSSQLSQEPNHNLFGIKGDYEGQSVVYSTWEEDENGNLYSVDAAFRMYPSVKESFEDYSKLLKNGLDENPAFYQATWKSIAETHQNATAALNGTYATDSLYSEKLDALIETYNLTQYDHEKTDFIISDSDFEPYNNVNYDTQNSYAWGNCTQYVYNRITQLGGFIDLAMGNGQDWRLSGQQKGYEVTATPKAGTAVSFNAGVLGADPTYGHVAFVEKVYEDGSILISEMNVVGLNSVSTRTISKEYTGLLAYISPK